MIWSCSHCVLPLLTTALFITLEESLGAEAENPKTLDFCQKPQNQLPETLAGQNPMRFSYVFRPPIANRFYRIHYFGGLNSFPGSFTSGIVPATATVVSLLSPL
jgi:hypothetical protein